MICRLIWNDVKKNKLTAFSAFLFFAVTAVMIGLTVLLSGNLLGAIDNLMEKAQTMDYLQMHAGAIDEKALEDFASSQDMAEQLQVGRFLNLNNGELSLGDASLSESTQDNGLCVQSEKFDYLLTLDNELAKVNEGEVLVPVCYRSEYDVKPGDMMQIGEESLRIAGFLRDSQMNSMMASSKRFLVHEKDYERFLKSGTEEYLIEFLLKEGSDVSAFETAYADAKLPCNGPAVTRPLIRLMNAMSDGMMVLIILLVSVVVLVISILCVRFILLTSLEKDKTEIGMLKAVGISRKDIRRLYFSKFLLLSGLGSLAGFSAAICLSGPLGSRMKELYGGNASLAATCLLSLFGIVLVEGLMLFSVRRVLGRLGRLSAVEALRNQAKVGKKGGGSYFFIGMVTAASMFLAMVPQNLSSTIAAPEFMTCMGVGNGQVRIDVRQTKDISEKARQIKEVLEADERVEASVLLVTKQFRIRLPDGSEAGILTELGNHEVFPVRYVSGGAPQKEGQLALSVINAEELKLKIGDCVYVLGNGTEKEYTICGIYSDITNGGKTAKAYQPEQALLSGGEAMWSIFYLSLSEGEDLPGWLSEYQNRYETEDGTGVKITDIQTFLWGTYGQTIMQIQLAAKLSMGAGLLILLVVVLLFVRMIVERERMDCSLKKALGFRSRDLRWGYLKKSACSVLLGILLGIFLGIFLGKGFADILLGALGAAEFPFVLNYTMVLGVLPLAVFFTAMLAVRLSLLEIKKIRAMETISNGA